MRDTCYLKPVENPAKKLLLQPAPIIFLAGTLEIEYESADCANGELLEHPSGLSTGLGIMWKSNTGRSLSIAHALSYLINTRWVKSFPPSTHQLPQCVTRVLASRVTYRDRVAPATCGSVIIVVAVIRLQRSRSLCTGSESAEGGEDPVPVVAGVAVRRAAVRAGSSLAPQQIRGRTVRATPSENAIGQHSSLSRFFPLSCWLQRVCSTLATGMHVRLAYHCRCLISLGTKQAKPIHLIADHRAADVISLSRIPVTILTLLRRRKYTLADGSKRWVEWRLIDVRRITRRSIGESLIH